LGRSCVELESAKPSARLALLNEIRFSRCPKCGGTHKVTEITSDHRKYRCTRCDHRFVDSEALPSDGGPHPTTEQMAEELKDLPQPIHDAEAIGKAYFRLLKLGDSAEWKLKNNAEIIAILRDFGAAIKRGGQK